MEFIKKAKFNGGTPLGTMLDRKILQPMLLKPARSNSLKKPLLVIVITDGEPQGEDPDTRKLPSPGCVLTLQSLRLSPMPARLSTARLVSQTRPYCTLSRADLQTAPTPCPSSSHRSATTRMVSRLIAVSNSHDQPRPSSRAWTSTPSSAASSTRPWRTTLSATRCCARTARTSRPKCGC